MANAVWQFPTELEILSITASISYDALNCTGQHIVILPDMIVWI